MKPEIERGFTLVEILIVVAIATVVMGLGAFSITNAPSTAGERGDVYGLLMQARQLAFTRHRCTRVSFTNTTIDVATYAAKSGADCTPPFSTPAESTQPTYTLPTNSVFEGFSGANGVLVFNIDGGLTPDQLVTFELKQANGGVAHFRIYPAIGQVRVR